ncbi:ATP-dependent DNA ligase [Litoribacter ruber]|uniref:ATP-dependent DNA ligase n=1 Tax=Litoribacter ruber TaxID=702568 RepID=UPI001BDA7A36|nr:ATP-dependent DNA ligase [Litoribacter ruber]MBT0810412.1 ATP-dependent DNA ligase [Litoribacter ruber]
MKLFASLFTALDQTNKTSDKLEALHSYFSQAEDKDKLWSLALFTHKRPKRQVTTTKLKIWCQEIAGIPEWLFQESYHSVGDLAETISLLLPPAKGREDKPLHFWISYLLGMEGLEDEEKKGKITWAWSVLDKQERFVFTKLITGSFRVGVSQNLVTRAVAEVYEMEKTEVAHRIMGNWDPDKTSFEKLLIEENREDNLSRPYPFYLAHPVEQPEDNLDEVSLYLAEWKWDGIRGQLINRKGEVYIWSRGEELVTEKFPELLDLGKELPEGTVLDGEIIPFQGGYPLTFGILQTRIGRKNLTKKILKDAPISFIAYDVLEWQGADIRTSPLVERRKLLEELKSNISHQKLELSKVVEGGSWQELANIREDSRAVMAEGLMLKRLDSPYGVGRKRGDWWKWKIEPLSIDGVLLYAQKGSGRRADLYSDYTLGVWQDGQLVPFAKAYSGLTDAELRQIDNFIKRNTKERFGPVRTVKPELVFEIAFEGIQESSRHKSGIALRFPRIARWRKDKNPEEANTLTDLKELLNLYGGKTA